MRLQIRAASVRIDEVSIGAARHGIDGQVAPLQVFLKGHRSRMLGDKAAVTWRDLAFQSRQRVLLLRLRVQVHWEIPADGAVSELLQLGRFRTHDDPVTLLDWATQQFIPDGATHEVDLHPHMLTEGRGRTIRHLAGAWLVMSSFALSGCGVGYLLQAGQGQWQVLRARQPLDKVIANDSTDALLKARLEMVREARDFASRELHLPDNGSYRSYSVVGRPYVVWNVVAAPEFSVEPKRWWFPITGSVAYRGYFRESNARKFADGLAADGYDTLVAGVSAYSTLGRFDDPLLDTMMPYGDLQLVGTIFHELAHQLIYVKNATEFNEAFAMSVEREGVARWLKSKGRGDELAQYRSRQEQQALIIKRFAEGRAQLAALYRETLPVSERRARKQESLAAVTPECANSSGSSVCTPAMTPGSMRALTMPTWHRSRRILIACRALNVCSPSTMAIWTPTMGRCALWDAGRPPHAPALCERQPAN